MWGNWSSSSAVVVFAAAFLGNIPPQEASAVNHDLRRVTDLLTDFVSMKTESVSLATELESLRAELKSLKSELKTVKSGLDSCLDSQADLRVHENDHVTLHLLQDTVHDLRDELTGLARTEEERRRKTSETTNLRSEEPWRVEMRSLRMVMNEMNVRQEKLEAELEEIQADRVRIDRSTYVRTYLRLWPLKLFERLAILVLLFFLLFFPF